MPEALFQQPGMASAVQKLVYVCCNNIPATLWTLLVFLLKREFIPRVRKIDKTLFKRKNQLDPLPKTHRQLTRSPDQRYISGQKKGCLNLIDKQLD